MDQATEAKLRIEVDQAVIKLLKTISEVLETINNKLDGINERSHRDDSTA